LRTASGGINIYQSIGLNRSNDAYGGDIANPQLVTSALLGGVVRKRMLIPVALAIALGGFALANTDRVDGRQMPTDCDNEICKTEGGCREMENAMCEEDPCRVVICM